jgi:hypothetical protein
MLTLSGFTGKRLSFLELIEAYDAVEIPLIQRDYAQGRDSAKEVRARFLRSLFKALAEGRTLSLDFVYGKADEAVFQPIDGQQRLTTLFLLHWFLAHRCGEWNDFRTRLSHEGKSRFRYSVRPSSGRFFSQLLEYVPSNLNLKISRQITNQSWFFKSWLHDPTVASALNMLDAIQSKSNETDGSVAYYGRLGCISMEVLSLGDLISADDVYLKMNARGKELTGFEKFKAWLIGTHENLAWSSDRDDQHPWHVLLDGDWLDLFWSFHADKTEPAKEVSAVNFKTFVAMAVNFHAMNGKVPEGWLAKDGVVLEEFWVDIFTQNCVEHIFSQMDWLSARVQSGPWPIEILRGRLEAEGVALFSKDTLASAFFENTKDEVTFERRLWLHAIDIFSRHASLAESPDHIHWFRVVRNLLANIEVRTEDFTTVLANLEKLGQCIADAGGSVIDALAAANFPNEWGPKQFAKQLSEERQKAQKIQRSDSGNQWEPLIKEVETHPVIRGQIELLLPQDDSFDTFEQGWILFKKLMNEGSDRIGGADEYLVMRAVLSQCEPISLGSQDRIEFPVSNSDWSVALGRNRGNAVFRKGMVTLIDCLRGVEDVEGRIREILNVARGQNAWMGDLIHYGGTLLNHSSSRKVQQYYEHGVFLYQKNNSTEGDILLGPTAALRNHLIQSLLDLNWKFTSSSEESWRKVPLEDASEGIFLKGHRIPLRKESVSGDLFCRFGYRQLVLGEVKNPDSLNVEIPYPADSCMASFLEAVITKKESIEVGSHLGAALDDLLQVPAQYKEGVV